MTVRRALVTGIAGQDGSLLAELLLNEGIEVVGIDRSDGAATSDNLAGIAESIQLVQADLADADAVSDIIAKLRPDYVFHLASASFVPASWSSSGETVAFAALSTSALLDAITSSGGTARFVYAASAEIFGHPSEFPQTESTRIAPVTPYGVGKASAYFLTQAYRERHGLHASSAILYNHESTRRPVTFVSRKVTRAAAAISLGLETELRLGNLDARRDWTYAGDVVAGLLQIARTASARDYLLASGEARSVRELVEAAFDCVDLDYRDFVIFDEAFARPNESLEYCGDPSLAERELGWTRRYAFRDWVRLMVEHDLAALSRDREPA